MAESAAGADIVPRLPVKIVTPAFSVKACGQYFKMGGITSTEGYTVCCLCDIVLGAIMDSG